MHELKLALVGAAVTLIPAAVGLALAWLKAKKAKLEAEAWKARHAQRLGEAAVAPDEAQARQAQAEQEVADEVKAKTKRTPKAPLTMLLAMIGLAGCSLPATIQLPGHPHPVAREKAERVLRPHCGGCQRLAFDLSGYTVQNMVGPYIQQVDQRFGLVGARLDHLEQGVAAVSTFTVDPDIQRVVDALKAQAQAQAREAAKRQGASK